MFDERNTNSPEELSMILQNHSKKFKTWYIIEPTGSCSARLIKLSDIHHAFNLSLKALRYEILLQKEIKIV